MEVNECSPSLSQAKRLKKYSQEGKLTEDVIDAIMTEEKKDVDKVTLQERNQEILSKILHAETNGRYHY